MLFILILESLCHRQDIQSLTSCTVILFMSPVCRPEAMRLRYLVFSRKYLVVLVVFFKMKYTYNGKKALIEMTILYVKKDKLNY